MPLSANPFAVQVPDIQPAINSFRQGYATSHALQSEAAIRAARQEAQTALMNGGDTNAAFAKLLGAGDYHSALALAGMNKDRSTSGMREYNLAKSQGFKGSFLDYQTQLANARASRTNIALPPQEKAYDKKTGEFYAGQNIDLIKGSQAATRKLGMLDALGKYLKDPNVYSGAAGEKVLQAKKIAKAIGIDVGNVGAGEAARSISNQLALELRNPAGGAGMPGAMSDKDREFLQSSVPSLQLTPQGNAKLIDYAKRVAQRAIDVEHLRQQYVARHGRLDNEFFQQLSHYSDSHPLFAGETAGQQPAVVAPNAMPGVMPPATPGGVTSSGVQWRIVR